MGRAGCACTDRIRGDRSRSDRSLAFVPGYPGEDRAGARVGAGADVVFSSVEPGESRNGRGVVVCACEPGHTNVGAGIGVVYGRADRDLLDHLALVRGSVLVIALYPGEVLDPIASEVQALAGTRPFHVLTFPGRVRVNPQAAVVFTPWPY